MSRDALDIGVDIAAYQLSYTTRLFVPHLLQCMSHAIVMHHAWRLAQQASSRLKRSRASVSKMQAGRAASVSHACSHAFVMRSLVPARHEMVVGAVWGPTALGDAMLSAAALALDMTVSRQGCTCTVVIFCF